VSIQLDAIALISVGARTCTLLGVHHKGVRILVVSPPPPDRLMTTEAPNSKLSLEAESSIVAAHIAEYEMVTTRNTYFITLTNALFPTLFIALALIAQLTTQIGMHPALWAATAITQFITVFIFAFASESYRNVLYLEQELRPTVLLALRQDRVWCYEDYLQRQRKLKKWVWDQTYLTLGLPLIVIAVAVVSLRDDWKTADWLCLAANGVGLLVPLNAARIAAKLRRELDVSAVQKGGNETRPS